QHDRPDHLERLAEQLVVILPAALLGVEADLLDAQFALELEEALRRADPDRPGPGVDAADDLVEELLVELRRRLLQPGKARHFAERLVDLRRDFLRRVAPFGGI